MHALEPRDIGIILSYLCGSECKHCLYNCGPGWEPEAMSAGRLREALETVSTWPEPPQVHLTGGEPFLHFDLLLEGARYARNLGLICYVETSAMWCTREDEARERFAALKDAGLRAVLVSCSPFHAEAIPPVRTLRAIGAALDVFGPNGLIVYLPEFVEIVKRFGLDEPTPIERYEELLGRAEAERVLWQGYGIIAGGRSGYLLGHLVPSQEAEAFAGSTCATPILHAQHSHFDLYGNYITGFCGGLSIGDWRALPQLMADFQIGAYPPLVAELVAGGPYGLYSLAARQWGYEPLAEGYAGQCHLCVDVRRHLARTGGFRELRPARFYESF